MATALCVKGVPPLVFSAAQGTRALVTLAESWHSVYLLSIPHRGLFIALFMARSIKKGPYVDVKLLKKVAALPTPTSGVINTWARGSQISPEMIGYTFGVHNGKQHVAVLVSEDMVGHRLGEFSPTKKFVRHGGKMQKEIEQKRQESEIAAAKAAKTAPAAKK